MTSVPEKPRPDDPHVVLTAYPNGGGKLVIDGKDVSSLVRRVSVEAGIEAPVMVVELGRFVIEADVSGGGRELRLQDGAEEVLREFGWTPPGEAP